MKAVFFDFAINFGGAPQGTVSLGKRLSEYFEIHIIDAYGSSIDYIKAIEKYKLNLHVLCPDSKKIYIGHKGKHLKRLFAIAGQFFSFLKMYKRLHSSISTINPDVIWVNNEKSLIFLLGSLFHPKIPIVFYVRGWGTKDQISHFLLFLLHNRVSFILAHAKATVDQLISLGIPQKKIVYAPNAIEINIDPSNARMYPPILPGLKNQLKILLPAARAVQEKGHLVAVKALRRLVDNGFDAIMWFPGKNAVGVGQEFMNELKVLIRQLGLEDRIFFIGWREDLQQVIANADVVILPSHTEGFPRVVIEAMLLGVPVCATPVGGICEAINDGETGFIFPVDDDISLAEKISTITMNQVLRDNIIKKAFDFASRNFVLEVHTKTVKNTFIQAINTKRKCHSTTLKSTIS